MNSPATKLTYHDYQFLPDDGKRYEVIDGDLYMTPAPVTRHQMIVTRLSNLLFTYLERNPIGTVLTAPCDVLLSDVDVLQPDLLIVLQSGLARITDKNVQGPPDLVIEILSPGTAGRDRDLKHKRYEHFGVREYWLVDPDQNTVEILRLKENRFTRASLTLRPSQTNSTLLSDLTLDLALILK
jgi:Uma2 family endonuclease